MKNIGIIRRVDDLGRIVIPRDIRRLLHIKEGDAMEIFVGKDSVIFKKYQPLYAVSDALDFFKEIVTEEFDLPCRTEFLQTISEMEVRLKLESDQ